MKAENWAEANKSMTVSMMNSNTSINSISPRFDWLFLGSTLVCYAWEQGTKHNVSVLTLTTTTDRSAHSGKGFCLLGTIWGNVLSREYSHWNHALYCVLCVCVQWMPLNGLGSLWSGDPHHSYGKGGEAPRQTFSMLTYCYASQWFTVTQCLCE